MTHFTSVDKFIVEKLRSSDAISLYVLHQEFEFSPLQLQDSCIRLEKFELARLDRRLMVIIRLPGFFENLIKHRHKIYNRDPFWKRPNKSSFGKRND